MPPVPRLSVIVTTHHRPNLLARALGSATALGDDVQVVLCADEGSRETRQIATENLRAQDIFVSVPGLRGPAMTRNLGLRLATGLHVCFLDDDDSLSPDLATLLPILDGQNVFYTNYRKLFEVAEDHGFVATRRAEKSTKRKPIHEILVRNFLNNSGYFPPRRIAAALEFNPQLTASEDWEFILQLYERAPFRHCDIMGSNWHFLDNGASRDSVTKKERAENYIAICAAHPSPDDQTRLGRLDRLRELGVDGTNLAI